MQTSLSPEQQTWARRHRVPHAAFLRGKKPAPLDERVSKRFAWEFEAALTAHGAVAAKEARR